VRRDRVFERCGGERHHQPRITGRSGLHDLDDVGMMQASQHLDLAAQCIGANGVVRELDRHLAGGAALCGDENNGMIGAGGDRVEFVADGERGRIVGVHAA
jgi:hypothetical protein